MFLFSKECHTGFSNRDARIMKSTMFSDRFPHPTAFCLIESDAELFNFTLHVLIKEVM